MKEERSCMKCKVAMKPSKSHYKEFVFDSFKCPKCKIKIFTQKQVHKVVMTLEAKRLEDEYLKKPIKIGNSWGLTFPKEVAQVFNISSKMKFKLLPNLKKQKIELIFQ